MSISPDQTMSSGSGQRPYAGSRRVAGARVGSFSAADLPSLPDFEALLAAVAGGDGLDAAFVHAPETEAYFGHARLERGRNLFGVSQGRAISVFERGGFRMRSVETLVLHDALFSPQSMTVSTVPRGFYDVTLANFYLIGRPLSHMTALDAAFVLDAEGEVCYSSRIGNVVVSDAVALPICGTGFHNYGHFLYDGLPFVHQIMTAARGPRPIIVGPPLREWQRSVLDLLGLACDYREVRAPVIFRRVIASSLVSLHVPYPTRYLRPLLDTIRFRIGGPTGPRGRKVFISRGGVIPKRELINREAVEACFAQAGFEIVRPETMPFPDQVRLFSACSVVAGESGAGMANVAFCDPGTKVLEIQPGLFVEGWTRATCMLFAHEWHVLFAEAEKRDKPEPGVEKPRNLMRFEVDLEELKRAIEVVSRK